MSIRSIPLTRIIFDSFILAVVWLPVLILKYQGQPHQRGFFCDDQTIRYPFRPSTITNTVLYLVGNIGPIVFITAIEAYRTFVFDPAAFCGGEVLKPRYKLRGRSIPIYFTSLFIYLGYFYFGMAITVLLTDMGKFTIGRLRPHFISVCQPDHSILTCSKTSPYQYIDNVVCNGNDIDLIREARLSFPSGHSSFSAYTMIYLVLYLQSRMIRPLGGVLAKHLFQFVALTWTYETCMTRVNDFKHHWSDVVAGFILGTGVAIVIACHVAGLFRRPHFFFAKPRPFDHRDYTGAQIYLESMEETALCDEMAIPERETKREDI